MLHVLGCITEQHDLRLVVLAGVLCLFACAAAMSMIARSRAAHARVRTFWLAAAGLVAGSGIWGTHFVAMLAYRSGFPVAYDANLTILSVVIAAVLCGAGFAVALGRMGPAVGGAIVGAAIAAMHYVGMAAVRAPADAIWDLRYVVASVVVGVGMMAVAMHIVIRGNSLRSSVTGTVLFTLAIVSMHFTGMSAVVFRPDPLIAMPDAVVSPLTLAVAVAAVAVLIVALGLIGALMDHHLAERASGEAERLRLHISELESTKLVLEKTSHDLSVALAAAAAANSAKSAFLAAMSHELRTPLNAVIGFSEMMTTQTFGALGHLRYLEYAHDIRASGAHLLSLINDVLDLSRLDAGQATLAEEDLDLAGVIAEAMRMVAQQAQAAGVGLQEDIEAGLPFVRGDRRRLRQVIVNLLANAVKFTPAGGKICARACRTAGTVAIVVMDTGIGIAQADIQKAFERFGQVDSTLARKYEGAGLGLPLAKQLVELHGGTLTLESEVNVGTTVTVFFPAERIVSQRMVA